MTFCGSKLAELGGRVYSLFDKRINKEVLFSNPVVKPVRILPVWAFISGGIEFNFPIAHSPTSITEVGCTSGLEGNYGFIRVGDARPAAAWNGRWNWGWWTAVRHLCNGRHCGTRPA